MTYLNGETPVNISEIGTGDFTIKIVGNDGLCKGSVTAPIHIDASIALNGTGTEADPYRITSNTDWNTFADAVNAGHTFSGEYLKLKPGETGKITLTINNTVGSDKIAGVVENSSAGTAQKWFSGTFDGGWDTIVFNVGTSDVPYTHSSSDNFFPSAPFRAIDGATIKNLTVKGNIYSDNKYNSGLVGYSYNTNNNIISCTSSIVIDCSNNTVADGDCSSAGFVAENKKGTINFTNCIFNGTIDRGSLDKDKAQKCAGFVSYNGGTVNFTNCTMAGIITLTKERGTYYRKNTANFSNAYYINDYGGVNKCIKATNTVPTESVARKYELNSTTYYVPGAIVTGWETTTYTYIEGQSITIDAPTVTYYGRTLTRGTDYRIKLDDVLVEGAITISTEGIHPLKIEGIGDIYGGSYTVNIKYVNFNSWAIVQSTLADGSYDRVITLNADITPATNTDRYLEVNGNVVLNLNGKTIDRNLTDSIVYGQVIRVNAGASLTINGPGTIRGGFHYPGTDPIPEVGTYYAKRDAGGIHNMGSLVLNNVDVIHNKCVKEAWGSEEYTARGGGIYSGSGSSLVINGGRIESNEARGGGGGVYSDCATTFTMRNVNVNYNQSESKGGGVRVKTTGSNVAELTGCKIYLNLATAGQGEGGGVFMEGGELHMTDCEIMGNQSRYRGCGFHSVKGKTIATNCNISLNGSYVPDPTNYGGGVCLNNSGSDHTEFIMNGGTIEGNNSAANGGGIYVYGGADFKVQGNVIIRDNYKASVATGATDNNAYLLGTSVINVIGDLGEDAVITITPRGGAKTYVTFAEGVTGGEEAMKRFHVDNNDHDVIIDSKGGIEVYEPYLWTATDTWNNTIAENTGGAGTIPTSGSTLTIHRSVRIPKNNMALAGDITTDKYCNIIIEDGAKLVTTTTRNVNAWAKKVINKATAKTATGWYLLSSLVNNTNIQDNTNLITVNSSGSATYDLYRFNESVNLQWENYRYEANDFTTLQSGRGYLYRNANNLTVNIKGELNVLDVLYPVTYTSTIGGNDNVFPGFNLVGNPYSDDITMLNTTLVNDSGAQIVDGESNPINLTGFYRFNSEGSAWEAEITSESAKIAPLEGFLVQVPAAAKKIKFSKTARGAAKSNGDNIKFTVANGQYEDVAYALFERGFGLNKISHLNEDNPMLYINKDKENFAIATMNPEVKQFNLNFEAMTTGWYTLSVKPQGAYRYLHLIDKLAEKDIDLLEESEYSFVASAADNADRFIVRLSTAESEDDTESVFAYQSGSDIVVSGEGELQVFDVTGRLISKQYVNGVATMCASSLQTGVYILKLNENTQKIVVR